METFAPVPAALRTPTAGADEAKATGGTGGDAIEGLESGLDATALKSGDRISNVPAGAGR